LEHAISTLQELKNAAIGPGAAGVVHAVETANLLEVAEMILRAALMRDESRGPHLRFRHFEDLEPLPREERWDRYIVISKLAEAMHLEPREPVRPPQ
jgi:succinate dehydrogenase / fumarate reductase flavoprotein subunit